MTDETDPVPRDVGRIFKRFASRLAAIHIKAQRILLELTFDPKQSKTANKLTCESRLTKLKTLCNAYRTADATYDCDDTAYLTTHQFCDAVYARGGRFLERMGIKTFIKSRGAGTNERVGTFAGQDEALCPSWQDCTGACTCALEHVHVRMPITI